MEKNQKPIEVDVVEEKEVKDLLARIAVRVKKFFSWSLVALVFAYAFRDVYNWAVSDLTDLTYLLALEGTLVAGSLSYWIVAIVNLIRK